MFLPSPNNKPSMLPKLPMSMESLPENPIVQIEKTPAFLQGSSESQFVEHAKPFMKLPSLKHGLTKPNFGASFMPEKSPMFMQTSNKNPFAKPSNPFEKSPMFMQSSSKNPFAKPSSPFEKSPMFLQSSSQPSFGASIMPEKSPMFMQTSNKNPFAKPSNPFEKSPMFVQSPAKNPFQHVNNPFEKSPMFAQKPASANPFASPTENSLASLFGNQKPSSSASSFGKLPAAVSVQGGNSIFGSSPFNKSPAISTGATVVNLAQVSGCPDADFFQATRTSGCYNTICYPKSDPPYYEYISRFDRKMCCKYQDTEELFFKQKMLLNTTDCSATRIECEVSTKSACYPKEVMVPRIDVSDPFELPNA